MTDIEIAKNTKLEKIENIAKKLEIEEQYLENYGKYKAKISNKIEEKLKNKEDGKLVLVTAMSPTPLGEGKTTVSIAIADGLNEIGKKAMLALREPSLGPVFGIKGGATGGGHAQVAPMEDINLHFTGDIHAITSANNLLSSLIDNHIYFGNELGFKEVTWKRCVDLNDRQLRQIETGLSGEKKIVPRPDKFDITVASEIMAILCLSKDLQDLKRNLSNIIVGYNNENMPIYARNLKAEGAMTVLLKDAIKPNLVQTLEGTPALIHGGPFANIAHGCNSVIATKMAMKLSDYVITEAGFGADLGAEKFLNIKARKNNLEPSVVILVATIKAIKYHGGVEKEKIQEENLEAIEKGLANVYRHIDNLKNKFGQKVIVALNKYSQDTEKEIQFIEEKLQERNIEMSLVEGWEKGSEGAKDIANKIVQVAEEKPEAKLQLTYEDEDSMKEKIEKIATKIYGAKEVEYTDIANSNIEQIEKLEEILLALAEQVTYRLRKYDLLAKTVNVQLRTNNFEDTSHQGKLDNPTATTKEIYEKAKKLLNQMYHKPMKIRLIGLRVDNLIEKENMQISLFQEPKNDKQEKLDKVVDELKNKYGYNKITRAGKMNTEIKLKDI